MIRASTERWRFVGASIFWVTVTLAVLKSGAAAAQEPRFGERGHVALSAERLSGFVHTSATLTGAGPSMTQTQNSFFLLGNPLGGATGYAWPRIALDGFVAQNVSVGAAAMFFHISPESGSVSGFAFAPRVGYAVTLSNRATLWPRLGFTYQRVSSDSGGDLLDITRTLTLFALTIEAPVVIMLVPRAAITIGPTLDLGVGGSISGNSAGGQTVDQDYTDFGILAGLLLFL